jgi:hypothetical protein
MLCLTCPKSAGAATTSYPRLYNSF